MAERILYNLQKGIVDSTISTAAGLEDGSSYSATPQALPYYESPLHVPTYVNQNSLTNESSNNGDEAARIAYNNGHYIEDKWIEIKNVTEINKASNTIWEFTYT